jgi:hypothetical protein
MHLREHYVMGVETKQAIRFGACSSPACDAAMLLIQPDYLLLLLVVIRLQWFGLGNGVGR